MPVIMPALLCQSQSQSRWWHGDKQLLNAKSAAFPFVKFFNFNWLRSFPLPFITVPFSFKMSTTFLATALKSQGKFDPRYSSIVHLNGLGQQDNIDGIGNFNISLILTPFTVLFQSIRPWVWPVTNWTKFHHRTVGMWPVTGQKFRLIVRVKAAQLAVFGRPLKSESACNMQVV